LDKRGHHTVHKPFVKMIVWRKAANSSTGG
jgi:hypothetical protein